MAVGSALPQMNGKRLPSASMVPHLATVFGGNRPSIAGLACGGGISEFANAKTLNHSVDATQRWTVSAAGGKV